MRKSALLLASAVSALLLAGALALVTLEDRALASFPGEDGLIAFGGGFFIASDGSGASRDLGDRFGSPEWSPNGNRIAYGKWDAAQSGYYDVYVAAADGSAKRRLTHDAASGRCPSWSPHGSRLAFLGSVDGRVGIYTMAADGSGKTLAYGGPGAGCPEWAPEGGKLAFAGTTDGTIYTTDATPQTPGASEPVPLAKGASPDWSPDGQRLVFRTSAVASSGEGSCLTSINTINADGTNEQVVRQQFDACGGEKGESYLTTPLWSPDGTRLAYAIGYTNGSQVFVSDLSGTETARVCSSWEFGLPPYDESCDAPLSDWQAVGDATRIDTLLSRRPSTAWGWHPRRATFGFASNKGGATFRCSLDEGPYEPCTSPKTYTGLSHGAHRFRVRSESAAGVVDRSPATHEWKVDARKPTITEVRPRPGITTTNRTPRISAVVEDAGSEINPFHDGGVRLYVDGEETYSIDYESDPETPGFRLVYRYAEGERLSLGEHTVRWVVRDRVGNAATRSWSFTVTR